MFHTNCEKLGKEDQWGSPPGTGTALWLCTKVRYSNPPGVSTRRGETEKAEAVAVARTGRGQDTENKTRYCTPPEGEIYSISAGGISWVSI